MRNNQPEEIRKTKQVQPRSVERNAAAAPELNEAKEFNGVQSTDHSAPSIHDTAKPQNEISALGPLLWILIPLVAVIIWQIFLIND